MAARRMTKLLRLGLGSTVLTAAPLTYTGFRVYAASPNCVQCNCPPPTCTCPSPRVVKISELPIYSCPEDCVQICVKPEEISLFRSVISDIRCAVWDYLGTVQETTDVINKNFNIGKSHAESMIDFLQNDPAVLPRVTVITVAGLGGIVAGYRGGLLRKLFYSATAITAATSLCYPKEAVAVTSQAYHMTYAFLNDLLQGTETKKKTTGEPTRPWVDNKNQNANTSPNENATYLILNAGGDQNQNAVRSECQVEDNPEKAKLRDQSIPEDKDMYTTRSN